MATGKKYYWIKLKTSFLTSDKVDYLLSQKGGANYVVIYQMLCLKTINSGGELCSKIGEVMIPYNIEKIQRDLKHFDIDTIRVALELYKNLDMVYEQDNGVFRITEFNELIGSETDYAAQKRKQRQLVDSSVDNVHIELESDLDSRKRDRERVRDNFSIIKDRYIEAGMDKEKLDEIGMMMLKAYDITHAVPDLERIQDFTNDMMDRDELYNKQGYLIQCFKNV